MITINKYASQLEQVWDTVNWNRKFKNVIPSETPEIIFNSYDIQSVYEAEDYFHKYADLETEESSDDADIMIVRSAYLFSDSSGEKIAVIESFC